MKSFFSCILYLAILGIIFFWIGEALPRRWIHPDQFPFRCAEWEQSGRVYDQFHIRLWKDKVPDLSRLLPDMVPKRLCTGEPCGQMGRLIPETCVAELTHDTLILTGFVCLWIWPGTGGTTVSLLWAVGNVPFIMIQRYNRPRLAHLAGRLDLTNHQKGVSIL